MTEGPGAINVRLPSSVDPTGIRSGSGKNRGISMTSNPFRSRTFLSGYRSTPQGAEAARKIERCWINYRNKQMFRLLKTAVVAAEHSLTKEIMRKIAPKEAVFFKDDNSVAFRIRFRFGGSDFPPNIYFKIYVSSESSCVVKYINGKKYIKSTTTAAEDALRLMGSRLYYNQILEDAMVHADNRIAEDFEITTLKDYMQYSSLLDETPANRGGKDNGWRRLGMDCLPRRTIFHDLVVYMNTKNVSERLKNTLPFLLARPLSPEMAFEQLRLIVDIWPAEQRQLKEQRSAAAKHLLSTRSQDTARRSRNAMLRAEKMKKAFTMSTGDGDRLTSEENRVVAAPSRNEAESAIADRFGEPEELGELSAEEEDIGTLYQWTRELTLDDMVKTPRLPSERATLTPSGAPLSSHQHR